MNKEELNLTEYSVTLRAKESVTHEFFNLHPHILAFAGVVPTDWTWERGAQKLLLTPGFCSITYENGIRISGNNETVNAAKTQDLEFGGTQNTSRIATGYIASLAPDVFQMAELNWEIEIPLEEPIIWMTQRFFSVQLSFPNLGRMLKPSLFIRFTESDLVTTFSFVPRPNKIEFLSIGGRIRTALPVDDEHLAHWLLSSQELENRMLNSLLAILEIENDSS